MRFTPMTIRPTPIERTSRRIKAAEKAVKRELEKYPLFPELARFNNAEMRLNQLDDLSKSYWQNIRDEEARTWRKFRRRLRSLDSSEQERFLDYWNSHGMIPGTAHYASDTLTLFFNRNDWRLEDIKEIQGV